jgi:hypothetical protein
MARTRAIPIVAALVLGCATQSREAPLEAQWTAERCPPGTSLRFQEKNWEVFASWPAQWCARPDGTKHGPRTEWYRNGHLLQSGELHDGDRVGTWVFWQRVPWWQRWRGPAYRRSEVDFGTPPIAP